MSQLPPEVHQALAQLLQGLQSPDNVLRTQAETQLNDEWANPRPEILLMGLSEQIEGSDDPAVCTRGVVRRAVKMHETHIGIDAFFCRCAVPPHLESHTERPSLKRTVSGHQGIVPHLDRSPPRGDT